MCQRFSACFVLNLASQRERGRKGRECKFQNKAHRTFDPSSSSTQYISIVQILFPCCSHPNLVNKLSNVLDKHAAVAAVSSHGHACPIELILR